MPDARTLVAELAELARRVHGASAMKNLISPFVLSFSLFAVACGGNDKPAEGPAEHAGEKVDEAADDVKEKADEAGDKMEEAGDKAEEKVEKEKKEE